LFETAPNETYLEYKQNIGLAEQRKTGKILENKNL
jgi:hypothetical protein